MDLERIRQQYYEHSAGRDEGICRCGHELGEHEQMPQVWDEEPSVPCTYCSCSCFDPSPPEPDYDAIFERRREEYFG